MLYTTLIELIKSIKIEVSIIKYYKDFDICIMWLSMDCVLNRHKLI